MNIAGNWRLQQQRYRLIGEVCEKCGKLIFPPRDMCPECEAPARTPFVFSGQGEVYSYSTVYAPPRGFEEFVPYTVALIRLKEGPMLTAQLTDVESDKVYIGMPVEMVTRKVQGGNDNSPIVYGYKFRPAGLG
jgi:uncharacterized OB-fold protein